MSRNRWLALATLGLAFLLGAAWVFFHQPTVTTLDAGDVRSVEVRFEPWGEEASRQAGASSADPEAIAALVAVLRSAAETPDHKCGSRGAIILRRSFGRSVELWFLPGHHTEWYEFPYAHKAYRVPRAEFVVAMQRVGVDVPLVCQ
jgi:hypothetical protein